jgi:glycosyltransferase involved in cell wall biosynthesis
LTQNQYIIFLGRLVPEKCPDLLIKSFQLLRPKGWKLVLVGGNSDTITYTKQLSQIAANNPDIVFTGELRGSRLAEIVRGGGLFVLPSIVEGLPLAMLEGMNEGIPVLASDIAPHQQLVLEGGGLLFQVGNVESCVQQLSWAIEHPKEMARMAEKASLNVKTNYSWDRISSETLDVYKSVLEVERSVNFAKGVFGNAK